MAFLEGDPDQPIVVENLGSSSTPGVSVLRAPGPAGAPTLDAVVCIQLGGVWQQAGTCEIAGGGIAPGVSTIPPATTLQVDPGGSLNDGGILTVNGNITNGGSLTVSPAGQSTWARAGSLNDGGILTLWRQPRQPRITHRLGRWNFDLEPGRVAQQRRDAYPQRHSRQPRGPDHVSRCDDHPGPGRLPQRHRRRLDPGRQRHQQRVGHNRSQWGHDDSAGWFTRERRNAHLEREPHERRTIINNGSFIDQGVFVDNGTCVNC